MVWSKRAVSALQDVQKHDLRGGGRRSGTFLPTLLSSENAVPSPLLAILYNLQGEVIASSFVPHSTL